MAEDGRPPDDHGDRTEIGSGRTGSGPSACERHGGAPRRVGAFPPGLSTTRRATPVVRRPVAGRFRSACTPARSLRPAYRPPCPRAGTPCPAQAKCATSPLPESGRDRTAASCQGRVRNGQGPAGARSRGGHGPGGSDPLRGQAETCPTTREAEDHDALRDHPRRRPSHIPCRAGSRGRRRADRRGRRPARDPRPGGGDADPVVLGAAGPPAHQGPVGPLGRVGGEGHQRPG